MSATTSLDGPGSPPATVSATTAPASAGASAAGLPATQPLAPRPPAAAPPAVGPAVGAAAGAGDSASSGSLVLPVPPAIAAAATPGALGTVPAAVAGEPVRYYAYHTRKKPKQPKVFRRTAVSAARTAVLASFDVESANSSSSFSGSSSSDSSDSSDDTSSSSEEDSAGALARRASKPRTTALTGKKSSAKKVAPKPLVAGGAAAAAAVARSAGTPASPAASSSSLLMGASAHARLKVVRHLEPVLNATLAPLVERALYHKHRSVNAAYNAQVRDLVQSLRLLQSASTPSTLLRDVFSGAVTPAQLVSMTTMDLANDDLRQQRARLEAGRLRDLQKPADEPSALAVLSAAERRSEVTASKVMDSVIQVQTSSSDAVAPAPVLPPHKQFHSVSSEFLTADSLAACRELVSTLQEQRRASLSSAAYASSSDSSSDMNYSDSDDDLLIVDAPPPRSQTKPAAPKPATLKAATTAAAAVSPAVTPSLKRKLSSEPSPRHNGATTPPSALAMSAQKRRKSVESLSSTPPPLSPRAPSLAEDEKTASESDAYRLHATDPISLPEFDPTGGAVPAYTGLLKLQLPRRGELPIDLVELPTRDLLPPNVCSAADVSSLRSTRNRWSHILLDELVAMHTMKATDIERYLRFKANTHIQPSHSGAKPSPSIQATSRYYPLSFVMQSTEPLLSGLLHDVSEFHRLNKLALALDFESSSIPPERQCALWIMPPGSLEFVPASVVGEVLHWTHAPRADEWWGVLWLKAFVLRAMARSVDAERRKRANEMDVPSDDEEDSAAMPALERTGPAAASRPAAAPVVAPVAAAPAAATPVQLIQNQTKLALTAEYLNSLLSKVGASSSAASAAAQGATVAAAPGPSVSSVAAAPAVAPAPTPFYPSAPPPAPSATMQQQHVPSSAAFYSSAPLLPLPPPPPPAQPLLAYSNTQNTWSMQSAAPQPQAVFAPLLAHTGAPQYAAAPMQLAQPHWQQQPVYSLPPLPPPPPPPPVYASPPVVQSSFVPPAAWQAPAAWQSRGAAANPPRARVRLLPPEPTATPPPPKPRW